MSEVRAPHETSAPERWRRVLGTLVLFGTVGLVSCQTFLATMH